jgi:hypothetical protein
VTVDLEGITAEKLQTAIEVLAQLSEVAEKLPFMDVPVDRYSGALMHKHLSIAELYLMEYERHLSSGMQPRDALLTTIAASAGVAETPRQE